MNFISEHKPRIAKARAAALYTRGSVATARRKRSSRKLSEETSMRRFSRLKAKFPTANRASLCTYRRINLKFKGLQYKEPI